ncbi:MAG: Uma2 family endonuclease [Chloroflexota bacterium]
MTLQLTRRRFTVTQYGQMAETGILTEGDRVELIDGEILEMTPIGRRHAAAVKRLNRVLSRMVGDGAQIGIQDPVRLDENTELQPDVTLLVERADFYASGHPTPLDVLLLIEVSDSTLQLDREIKVPLYARTDIREVWLVDLTDDAIVVCREPSLDGYHTVRTARRGEWLSPLAFPGREIAVSDILG